MAVKKLLIIPFFLNQEGCYRRCIFCNQHVITGFKPAEDLHSGLEEIVSNYLATAVSTVACNVQIAFYGGSFTSLQLSRQNEYLRCAQQFIHQGLVHSLRLSTRPDSLDETTCQCLKKFGVQTVEWCAKALCIFKAAGLPVVRMGLHPSESLLATGNIVAGPYHPAFGELVKSYLFREKVIDILGKGVLDRLSRSEKGQRISVSVGVHKADVSAFVGRQRSNLGEYYRRLEDIDIGWHIDRHQRREEFSCVVDQGQLVDHCSVFA